MSRVFFRKELETAASYWRIFRRDGVTLGFTTHDRDLWLDGILHRSAPGMVPSAIRQTASLGGDSAEMSGVLAHDAISEIDLMQGKYDLARIEIGIVDWENLEIARLYSGSLGQISTNDGQFTAELRSAKSDLERDLVPRTSPTCRARFCGPGCNLPSEKFTRRAQVSGFDASSGCLIIAVSDPGKYAGGQLRWIDGPLAGQRSGITSVVGNRFLLDTLISEGDYTATSIFLREGCDNRYSTCATRFGNTINFRGEPFLPGNDLLVRVPASK